MIKHLVTSGCSFADNCGDRWPHFLSRKLNLKLYNRGQGSAGNDWISDSAIYQVQQLLEQKISPDEIAVFVSWSGIDRSSIFISERDTSNFYELINYIGGSYNPVSFIGTEPNVQQAPLGNKGWLLGSPFCSWNNENIVKLKQLQFVNFYSQEERLISSLKHWLSLQWFCNYYGIKLLNFTFIDIFHFPEYRSNSLFYEHFPDTKYYFDMLDLKLWWFHENWGGIREWVQDNKLEFYPGDFHPAPSAHKQFAERILCTYLK